MLRSVIPRHCILVLRRRRRRLENVVTVSTVQWFCSSNGDRGVKRNPPMAQSPYQRRKPGVLSAGYIEIPEENVNYRHRKDDTRTKNNNVSSLWGVKNNTPPRRTVASEKIDEEKQKKNQAELVSFFQSLGDPSPSDCDDIPVRHRVKKSIFDNFPIPEPPRENAFDEDTYQQYLSIANSVIASYIKKQRKKSTMSPEYRDPILEWIRLDEKAMNYNLPLFENSVRTGIPADAKEHAKLGQSIRAEFREQTKSFLKHTSLDSTQHEVIVRLLTLVGNMCAKNARPLPLDIAWHKAKEAGVILKEPTLSTFMYASTMYGGSSGRRQGSFFSPIPGRSVLDMFDRSPSGETNDVTKEEEKNANDKEVAISEEIAILHDLFYEPTEHSLSIRVKALIEKGDAKAAEAALHEYTLEDLKLRTYLPILRCYLDQGDISSGLSLFKRMRDTPTVLLEPETYVQWIASIAQNGYFSSNSKPIEGAEQLGYPPCGPKLLDRVVGEMAEDVLEISSPSARRLYDAFGVGFRGQEMANNLVEMHPLAPLLPCNKPAVAGELVASRVFIDPKSGDCPRSGARLRLIHLDDTQKKRLKQGLLDLSESQASKRHASRITSGFAAESLSRFDDWLCQREGDPFTAIVDGANVAYYMQNFENGKFNWHQVQFMVDALEKMNERPLVVMPCKYSYPWFNVTATIGNRKQTLNTQELEILERLTKQGKIYFPESGCLDDLYWMLASISDQTISRDGKDMSVEPGDASGRWPGARPMLLTNDLMRDHKWELLEPRLFRRWFSCFIVNYNFTAFVDDECIDREISFSTADFFSREIQGNAVQNSKRKFNGLAWHFPVSDWKPNEFFCLRMPQSKSVVP